MAYGGPANFATRAGGGIPEHVLRPRCGVRGRRLVERHVGDWLHSLIQSNILFALRRKFPHLKVVPELRTKVADARFRLPDVCALLAAPETRYLLDAAYLVVEVLSVDDQMSAVMEKLKEYDRKGVSNIWLIDPRLRLHVGLSSSGSARSGRRADGHRRPAGLAVQRRNLRGIRSPAGLLRQHHPPGAGRSAALPASWRAPAPPPPAPPGRTCRR